MNENATSKSAIPETNAFITCIKSQLQHYDAVFKDQIDNDICSIAATYWHLLVG